MKAITAKPESVRIMFSKIYLIPNFQRPYSWEKEECEKLWEDIVDYYHDKESKEDNYFLGNIIVNPVVDSQQETWEVIDGQQRLITLLLLIKALHTRAGTVKALEECLRIKNPLTSELTDKIRVSSLVDNEDNVHLQSIVLHNKEDVFKCQLLDNYMFFKERIDDWFKKNDEKSDALHGLILMLLDNVVLLPIHCGSEDDALIIFETINNRGMALSDADIFKAKLYPRPDKSKQKDFIEEWNNLKDHDRLFRVLMHVLRAESNDTSKEIGLRSFFTSKNNPLASPDRILSSLKRINAISKWWSDSDTIITSLWSILDTHPNQYWNYPLFVFLHKHGTTDSETNEFVLPDKMVGQFVEFLEATVKYFFIKGVVYNSINAVRDTVFHVCSKIESEGNYLFEYLSSLKDDGKVFAERVKADQFGPRYLRGLVLLSAYLNPNQDKSAFSELVCGKYDIEHVLPQKWNHYDGWTEITHQQQLNKLGNLIPLPKALNIAAKNEFFEKKKIQYRKSKVQDAIDLAANVAEWMPQELERQQSEKLHRLFDWFGFKND